MDKGQRFIGCLLAVIAALLAVNIFAKTEQRAEAQVSSGPTVVDFEASGVSLDVSRLFRLWSDGRIETRLVVFDSAPFHCNLLPGLGCNWTDIETCFGDLDNSDAVDFPDLLRVLSEWGPCPE